MSATYYATRAAQRRAEKRRAAMRERIENAALRALVALSVVAVLAVLACGVHHIATGH
jgi:hypothetical protein